MNDRPVPPLAARPTSEPDRRSMSVGAEAPPRLPFSVVAVGAAPSAVDALRAFFTSLPRDSGMAFIVTMDASTDDGFSVRAALDGHGSLPFVEVRGAVAVQVNSVFVPPPTCSLVVENGSVRSEPRSSEKKPPIDELFKSVAEEQRERAIAVVLSGPGSDGSAGGQVVKAVGGLCLAQDPDTASHPSMPESLIAHGVADLVLSPEALAEATLRFARAPEDVARALQEASEFEREHVDAIVALIRAHTRQDFRGYRRPTLVRRIQRRMNLSQTRRLADYADQLRQDPAEVIALSDDLLIHVTGFFRDPEAWSALQKETIEPLVAARENGGAIRCWVTACSTGEEAYTLAMLLTETAEAAGKHFDIKIFATDTAHRSLAHARAGLYPTGIRSDIGEARLARFFQREGDAYRINAELRDVVVFAPQNVLSDPPFSRIDICTCRNLLIYLEPAAQARVLTLLHFGLRDAGVLFLGTSETIADGAGRLFEIVDKRHRIFRRVGPTRHGSIDFPAHRIPGQDANEGARPISAPRLPISQLTARALVERYAPAAVVVDRALHVVYFHGETEHFLLQPRGEPTRHILQLVREGLRASVRTALEALDTPQASATEAGPLAKISEQGPHRVWVTAAPLDPSFAPGRVLLTFEERLEPLPGGASATNAGEAAALREDLQRLREELQRSITEYQLSNEELRASNEEVTSINEELQSTNEELESSKEELQSLNEELSTVNAQLQAKIHEHETTSNDLASLLSSTDIAVLFLDSKFRIRRYTPAVEDLFDLIPGDVGRPLANLARKFVDPELLKDAASVLERLVPVEREVSSESGRWYLRRTLPYRTADDRIAGVVITFVDISSRKYAEAALREREEQFRLLVDGARDFAMLLLDTEGFITSWNVGAERLLGYSETEAVGQSGALIYTPEDRSNGEDKREFAKAAREGRAEDARWHVRKDGSRFFGTGVLRALHDDAGSLRGFVKVMRDDTARTLAEQALQDAVRESQSANAVKDEFLATLSHELRTPVSAMLIWTKLLEQSENDPELRAKAIDALTKSARAQSDLIEDLLDHSRISAGVVRLSMVETRLADVVTAAVDAVRPAAEEKGVALNLTVENDVGSIATAPDRVRQVLWNILVNAVKFTPAEGRVDVRLRAIDDQVELEVSDTGRGIDPSFLPHVFEPFRQGDSSVTRDSGGLGLGLAISKKLVELLGGQIEAHSAGTNRGASFVVRLPRENLPASEPVRPPESSPPATGAMLTGVHVLLVDDTEASREALVLALTIAGAVVEEATSAAEAVELYARAKPDVLLSDIAMPDINGYSLIRTIRNFEATAGGQRTPAIALTALARPSDRDAALSAGFDDYVAKPVVPDAVVKVIIGQVRARRRRTN